MPHTLADIAAAIGAAADGDQTLRVARPRAPAAAGPEDLALAMDPKFFDALSACAARAAIVPEGADWRAMGLQGAIFAPRSRYALAGVARVFDWPLDLAEGVHPSAVIEDGANIGAGAAIGPFVHIGRGARIGSGARILSNASIGAEAVIGDDALIHAGVRIGARVTIGRGLIAQPNACIGADGFSYVTPQPGAVESAKETGAVAADARNTLLVRIASLAAVTLGDDVEIGACACIDRGTIEDTRIGNGSKLDNLVQIGHNVQIGENCLICAHVGVAGSSRIGNRVVLAGQVGVADHVKVGDDSVIGAKSGIGSNVPAGSVLLGAPAVPKDEAIKSFLALRRLPKLMRDVVDLKKRLSDSGTTR